jgi:hypothetical protein
VRLDIYIIGADLRYIGEILDEFATARAKGLDNGRQLSAFAQVHVIFNY